MNKRVLNNLKKPYQTQTGKPVQQQAPKNPIIPNISGSLMLIDGNAADEPYVN